MRRTHCVRPSRFAANLRSYAAAAGILAAIAAAQPQALMAQAANTKWNGSAEASGNILYGAVNQRIGSMSAMMQRVNHSALYKFEVQAGYGDGKKTSEARRSVVVRNVRFGTTIDLRRRDRVSPYTFATALTSLQQRIASRVDAGAGARITVWRPDTVRNGFAEEATLSASMLGEQTRPISVNNAPVDVNTRLRWSLRANYRKRLSTALRLTHVTLYQPSVQEPSRLTLEATTVLAAPVYARTELTVTHRERIDSEAVERGAPSRRDGQILFGVRTSF